VRPAETSAEAEAALDKGPTPAVGAEQSGATTPCGHAPDYRWLTGQLHYSPARAAWCLRYAGGDDGDRHGGSVTLVGAGALRGLREGQAVRVEGEMIDPDSREPSAPYPVRRLGPLPGG
jgi:hypothetical protein